jgi:hypothetical protein
VHVYRKLSFRPVLWFWYGQTQEHKLIGVIRNSFSKRTWKSFHNLTLSFFYLQLQDPGIWSLFSYKNNLHNIYIHKLCRYMYNKLNRNTKHFRWRGAGYNHSVHYITQTCLKPQNETHIIQWASLWAHNLAEESGSPSVKAVRSITHNRRWLHLHRIH